MNNKPLLVDKYGSLKRVLVDAMLQAKSGKGKERHADDEPFENQKICVINRWLHGSPIAGPLFQAVKKTVESSRMNYDAAIRELYGAINYIAAGIILLEELKAGEKQEKEPLQIEMNCLCLDDGTTYTQMPDISISDINEKIRRLYQDKQEEALQSVLDEVDEVAPSPSLGPLCEDCFYGNIPPNDMPCKKCIDKPFRPHFTMTTPVKA
jgi:hypothetical protein